MSKILPDLETQVAERDRLVILNEEYFPCGSLRGHQVLRGKDMRISHIVDICYIPKIGAISNNPGCLLLAQTGVYWRNQLQVSFTEQD
jgi:hypothetical protein